jgi:hypothetical protein
MGTEGENAMGENENTASFAASVRSGSKTYSRSRSYSQKSLRVNHDDMCEWLGGRTALTFMIMLLAPLVLVYPLFVLPMGPASDRTSKAASGEQEMNAWMYGYIGLGFYLISYSAFLVAVFRPVLSNIFGFWFAVKFSASIVTTGLVASALLRKAAEYSSLVGVACKWNGVLIIANLPVFYLMWQLLMHGACKPTREDKGAREKTRTAVKAALEAKASSDTKTSLNEPVRLCDLELGLESSTADDWKHINHMRHKLKGRWLDKVKESRKEAAKWGMATVVVYFMLSWVLQAFIQYFAVNFRRNKSGYWRPVMLLIFFAVLSIMRTAALTCAKYVDLAWIKAEHKSSSRRHQYRFRNRVTVICCLVEWVYYFALVRNRPL